MRIALFLCLLLIVVAVFVQAKSRKTKLFKKSRTGKCEEYNPTRGTRSKPQRLYTDKDCENPEKSVSRSRGNGKRSVKQVKSSQQADGSTLNRALVKSFDNKKRQSNRGAKIQKKVRPKSVRQTTGKAEDTKLLKNKPSSSGGKKAFGPVKRSLPNSKQALAKIKRATKADKASLNTKKVSGRGKNDKRRKIKAAAVNRQNDAKLPVATVKNNNCHIQFSNGSSFIVKNSCSAISMSHFLRQPHGKCLKVKKGKKESVHSSLCDRRPRSNAKITKSRKTKSGEEDLETMPVYDDDDDGEYEDDEDEDNLEDEGGNEVDYDEDLATTAVQHPQSEHNLPKMCELQKGKCLQLTGFLKYVMNMPLHPNKFDSGRIGLLLSDINTHHSNDVSFNKLMQVADQYMQALRNPNPAGEIALTTSRLAKHADPCELLRSRNIFSDPVIQRYVSDC